MKFKNFCGIGVGLVAIIFASSLVFIGTAAAQTNENIKWEKCRGGECGRLTVPLDDTVVGGPTISLSLSRVKARKPNKRVGALVINPGGPGAPGAAFALNFASSLPAVIRDRFDIIGFDPRGVGDSAGVDCVDDFDALYALNWAPSTDAQRTELENGFRGLAEACGKSDGQNLPYLSTRRTARDLDLIRAALGEKRLTYLGYSYGTYLGAQYADQFPQRVRALVLDGGVDPGLESDEVGIQQAAAFENSLNLFLQDCSKNSDCLFYQNGQSAVAYDALRSRIEAVPLAVKLNGERRKLNGTLFDIAISQILYEGEQGWGTLAGALAAANDGDGEELLYYSDFYTGRLGKGKYDNLSESFFAVGCADGPTTSGVEDVRKMEAAAAIAAPRLGRSIVNNALVCAYWPAPAEPQVKLSAPTADKILVIGTHDDPATPLAWAKSLTDELGNAVLMTVAGSRHTAYASGNACVNRVVDRYLIYAKAPKPGINC